MLDSNFNLKIADFGFAAALRGKDGSGLLKTQLGTQSYMAPEIHLGKSYSGASVDLFAAAIILFIMVTKRPPFYSANPQDAHYKLLCSGRTDLFWKAHDQAEDPKTPISAQKDFVDLFEQMTKLNPKHRLSIDQILAHPWMKAPYATLDDIKKEFTDRKCQVDDQIKQEKDEKRAKRAEEQLKARKAVKRGEGSTEFDDDEEVKLEFGRFESDCVSRQTQFYSTASPNVIFRDLKGYLTEKGAEFQQSD